MISGITSIFNYDFQGIKQQRWQLEWQKETVRTVLRQAELLCVDWV